MVIRMDKQGSEEQGLGLTNMEQDVEEQGYCTVSMEEQEWGQKKRVEDYINQSTKKAYTVAFNILYHFIKSANVNIF